MQMNSNLNLNSWVMKCTLWMNGHEFMYEFKLRNHRPKFIYTNSSLRFSCMKSSYMDTVFEMIDELMFVKNLVMSCDMNLWLIQQSELYTAFVNLYWILKSILNSAMKWFWQAAQCYIEPVSAYNSELILNWSLYWPLRCRPFKLTPPTTAANSAISTTSTASSQSAGTIWRKSLSHFVILLSKNICTFKLSRLFNCSRLLSKFKFARADHPRCGPGAGLLPLRGIHWMGFVQKTWRRQSVHWHITLASLCSWFEP